MITVLVYFLENFMLGSVFYKSTSFVLVDSYSSVSFNFCFILFFGYSPSSGGTTRSQSFVSINLGFLNSTSSSQEMGFTDPGLYKT